MPDIYYLTLLAIGVGAAVGLLMSILYRNTLKKQQLTLEKEKEKVFEETKREAETIKKEAALQAKDVVYQAKSEVEKELRERRSELNQLDKRLRQKEEVLERKLDQIEKREHEFNKRDREYNNKERALQEKDNQHNQILKEQTLLLEKISGISSADARQELFKRVEEESRFDAAKLAKKIEDEAKENGEKKAKETISLVIQRYASEYVADATASAVSLPNDEMKGRIIGREGRNIRALEAVTGVDFIIDDTP